MKNFQFTLEFLKSSGKRKQLLLFKLILDKITNNLTMVIYNSEGVFKRRGELHQYLSHFSFQSKVFDSIQFFKNLTIYSLL